MSRDDSRSENSRLYAEARQRRREAEALAHVARSLTDTLDVSAVAERIVGSVQSLFEARSAGFRLLRPDGSLVAVSADSSGAHAAPGDVLAPGMGISGPVVAEGRPAWCRDMLTDPRFRLALARAGEAQRYFTAGQIEPPGAGASGRAAVEGKAVWTRDAMHDPDIVLSETLRQSISRSGNGAILAAPLRVKGESIGTLGIGDKTGRIFSLDEIILLEAFANHAALALDNARRYAEAERRRREAEAAAELARLRQTRLETLVEVNREVSRLQPVESLLGRIAEACGRLLGSNSVGFRLLEGDDLVVSAAWGDASAAMPTPRLKIGESLSGRVAATRQPLLVTNLADDPRLLAAHREPTRRLGHRAWLGVPILAGDRLLGVLSIRTPQASGFSAEDVAVVTAFAAQAATGLENARLYRQTQEAYEDLSRTQAQFLQAQKMEAVGCLAGGMAHDFNNLLTVIRGRTQLVLQRLQPENSLARPLQVIDTTAARAAKLTQQLLAFSRKQVLEPKVLDLNEVIAGADELLRRLIPENISLMAQRTSMLGRVLADPTQLEQVIVNLAVNARDAMPRGGRLIFRTANVDVGSTAAESYPGLRPGRYVTLQVADTGHGIDAETQARIFEPFFTTKGPGKGTGLGLATVYGIIEQSGGHIYVESELDQGTTFTIYLPRVDDVTDGSPVTPRAVPVASGSETILLVEDDCDVRELAQEILEAQGYRVLGAPDPATAVRMAEHHAGSIELLLTDVVMPGMSGRAVADHVRGLRPDVKVLYMSGYTDDAIVHAGVLDPGTKLLPKPFMPESLAGRVREVLDSSADG
ncbi:MAG: GAF domain-containing protein [Candidatus Rokubacteria bacterium]|nr:GAF domain-containing protein [Candidatus Rokubacteria bacterium]